MYQVEGGLPLEWQATYHRIYRVVQQRWPISSGNRPVKLEADKGTEFTSAEMRHYCLDIGTTFAFASSNSCQQISANERAGRTLANMVRCFPADSGLPKFRWGELMQTAVYLSNRTTTRGNTQRDAV